MQNCFRVPIAELFDAAKYLDAAVSAHSLGNYELAARLLTEADMPIVREWTESLWGANSPHVHIQQVITPRPYLSKEDRIKERMPSDAERQKLRKRDGFHCRFCGVPVIRKEVRAKLVQLYPEVVQWGRKNIEQHSALQAMWLQYDHIVPHSRGGDNCIENVVVTCAPCNFAKMDYPLEELGLTNPLDRPPIQSQWDGLERLLEC